MSISVLSGVLQCGPTEQAPAFVLVAIADNADDYGFAFPSQETIAQKARCDVRSVMRHVEKLEEDGWLRVGRKMNGRGNVYFVDLQKIGVSVSPMARKSPLFIRLEKFAGDKLSRIFLPGKTGDRKGSTGDNPQPGQVTKPASRPPTEVPQVTNLMVSGDKPCHTNHHQPPPFEPSTEPSGEPSTDVEPNPLPPLQGVDGSGWKDLASSLRRTFAEAPDDPPGEDSATIVTTKVREQFSDFRRQLQEDLGSIPANVAMRRFAEIQPGQNDFDTCFREWWLESVAPAGGNPRAFTLVTGAERPDLTRKGFEKYGPRLQHRARQYFGLSPQTAVRFVVVDANTNQQPAA